MKKALVIGVLLIAIGVGVWYFVIRRRVAVSGPNNGTVMPGANVLPQVTPAPGSVGYNLTDYHAAAIAATAQGACVSQGGNPQLCGVVGSVAQKVGKVYSEGLQKAGGAVVSGVKAAGSTAKNVAKKIIPFW